MNSEQARSITIGRMSTRAIAIEGPLTTLGRRQPGVITSENISSRAEGKRQFLNTLASAAVAVGEDRVFAVIGEVLADLLK